MRFAASSAIQFAASGCWMPWFLPIGRSKTILSLAYFAARLTAQRPRPTHSAAIRMRSGFMPCRMYSKPLPSSPMRSAAGTGTPSKNTWLESTAFRPIFSISRTSILLRSKSV